MAATKRRRSNRELFNMNFGFCGIQFGWALQMANMSAIYEMLKAKPDDIPALWLAAPLTGLFVQPLIGYLSDRTWTPLGRRRPYFLIGAILSTIALCVMPNVTTLAAAMGVLWMLDASINVSMEPFRAFVSDLLPKEQRTRGFATQSLMIGLGAICASSLPFLLHQVSLPPSPNVIPNTVRYAFYLGAVAFISAVLWTVFTTPEIPPEAATPVEVRESDRKLPAELWRLAPVQMLTWMGLFLMWIYFTPTVARHVFAAPDEQSPLYTQGVEWAGICMAFYSLVTFFVAFALEPMARRLGEGPTHAVCLSAGGLGLLSIYAIHNPNLLLLSMTGIGIAWASILSMPYSILSRNLRPESAGFTMGVFNLFIVIPEILISRFFGPVIKNWLQDDRLLAVCLGGALLLGAAALSLWLLRPSVLQRPTST